MNKRISFSYKAVVLGISAVLVVALLGAFTVGVMIAPYMSGSAQAAPALPAENPAQAAAQESDVLAAYENALSNIYDVTVPSVVSIQVTQKIDGQMGNVHPFDFGLPDTPSPNDQQPREFFDRGLGTGFVWDKDGHIVTNYHVVANATDVEVAFADGKTAKAEVLGSDPNADLAVIKVDLPASELVPVTLGDSDQIKVGQLTIAIGNPFGQEFTMTSGIVSAVGRTIRSGNTAFSIPQAIQTDTPINPGNSGGPLLNRQGAVIGINSQILSRTGVNNGIGFAVPVNTAKQVVPTLIKGENYEYAWLGISGNTVSPEISDEMNLPPGTQGALVIEVSKDSPADKAGLVGSDKTLTVAGLELPAGGDVITAINGQPIKTMDDLITYLIQNTHPGDTVTLDVIRDGKPETVNVTLGVRPSADELNQAQDK
jgi:S1-C subfamily serine protease